MKAFFTKDFAHFFNELEMNNNKVWFDANRQRYEEQVKAPFYNFIEALIDEVSKVDKNLFIDPKSAIFRIHKDVRFSKIKTPYKTHCSALIAKNGRKDMNSPGFYLELTAAGVAFYSGLYQPDAKILKSIRTYIMDHQDEFNTLLKDKSFKKSFGILMGEKSKVLSKEFKEAAMKQPYIFNKQFLMIKKWDIKMLTDKNLVKEIKTCFENARAMRAYLYEASIY